MKFLLLISIFIVSTASAISLGFLNTSVPAYATEYYFGLNPTESIYMITVGQKLGETLNLEASFGWESSEYTSDSESQYFGIYDRKLQAFGLGAFYKVTGNEFAAFSVGGRFIYSDLEVEQQDNPDKFKTTAKTFSPLARIDLNIPGIQNLYFHTQFGLNFVKSESYHKETYTREYEQERTDINLTAASDIFAGVYYQF